MRPQMEAPDSIAAYYRRPAVRRRIAEYCGGFEAYPASFSSLGLAGYGGRRCLHMPDMAPVPVANGALGRLLADGADVCRSFADCSGTLLQLDVDYVDPTNPAETYRRPEACFSRLEPVHEALMATFSRFGVAPLVLMTGRGYHYTVKAALGGRLHADLLSLAAVTSGLRQRYASEQREVPMAVSMGMAHEGAGRLLTHLVHGILRVVRRRTQVPVTLADVPPPGLGPFVCLDLSAYGDPLTSRHTRCAFSSHQKAWMTTVAPESPFLIALPRQGLTLPELLAIRADGAASARLAEDSTVSMPTVDGAPVWVAEYRRSLLASFYHHLDEAQGTGPDEAAAEYARLPPETLPACLRQALRAPNPGLLVPSALRAVALVLWKKGWPPRTIADLVRSRFEADHGWGDLWRRYEASARADFYVRLFTGAVVAGVDDGSDFTCAGYQARRACPGGECGHELGALFPAGQAVRSIHGLS